MLGKGYLCAIVTQDAANWPTPIQGDSHLASTPEAAQRRISEGKTTLSRLVESGQAAPASSSSHGSRQGLWLTPKTGDNHATKHHPQRSDGGQPNLAWQMEKEEFPTPRTTDWKSTPNAPSNPIRVEDGTATLGEFVHAKQWQTPRAQDSESGKKISGMPNLHGQARQWATPTTCNAPEAVNWETFNGQYFRKMDGRKHQTDLSLQVKGWATPQAKDHKSGHRDPTIVQYKQLNVEVEARATGKLNPRWVETLMGLPIGWTMPSCTSPQTIAPTSCDSSAMALSQPAQSERSES